MKYRPFGKLGFDVSTFGFGAMRLPKKDGAVDEAEAIRMLRRAVEGGVNYFDTAYVYEGGNSEPTVGKAFAEGGLHDKVRIATKLATWLDEPENYERQLDTSLKRLQTDHIDFYLFHAISKERWEKCGDAVMKFMDDMVKKGKVLFPSFSYHDDPDFFRTIIDVYDWKMAQVQINFLDADATNQASMSGIEYAAEKGVPVIAMEPLRGGNLALSVPPEVQKLYDDFPVKRSPVEWAFRYLYNLPQIVVQLSGVSTMEQLEDNLRIFDQAEAGCMDAAEAKLIEDVVATYKSRIKAGCTGCRYCMPCPAGVNIPGILQSYDNASLYGNPDVLKHRYERMVQEKVDASQCVECGACEAQCPQGIHIIDMLKEAAVAAE